MVFIQVEEKQIPGKGMGVFTKEFVPEGKIIWKLSDNAKEYTVEEYENLPYEIKKNVYQSGDKFVGAEGYGESWNHSCEPNTWWVSDNELAAKRDIQIGEELTYDYVTADVYPEWTAKWECNCGAKNCRGRISSNDCFDKDWQKRNEGHLPSWVVVFIEKNKKV
jgi:SET domain-containing protein